MTGSPDCLKEGTKHNMAKHKCGVVITPEDLHGCDWGGKLRENGLNTLGLHAGGGEEEQEVLALLGRTAQQAFRQSIGRYGIQVEYELHSACSLLPRALFAEHPDYFPVNKLTQQRMPHGNWCISNPGVREVLRRNVRQLGMLLAPSTHRHYLWGADGINGWCHCDACGRYGDADQGLQSVNLLAEALAEQDPAAEAAYLAYNQSTYEFSRKPAANVFLEFAPITRCYRHTIDDPACAVNRYFMRQLKKLLRLFDPRRTQVLEYWLDSSYFSRWRKPAVVPVCTPELIARDLDAYRRLGIRHFTTFAVYMDGEYFERYGDALLRAYAANVA